MKNQEIKRYFDEYVFGFIKTDIQREIDLAHSNDSGGNFLAALGLLCYTVSTVFESTDFAFFLYIRLSVSRTLSKQLSHVYMYKWVYHEPSGVRNLVTTLESVTDYLPCLLMLFEFSF